MADAIAAKTGKEIEIVRVTTEGDTTTASLKNVGGTGVFATALRQALRVGDCDVVVHSLKDLPTAPAEGLALAAVPKRADARDALCARDGLRLADLPEGSRVGTGSPRRRAQLRSVRPVLEVIDIRGNVDTRLGRVGKDLDAVVLAAAGLGRLGRTEAVTELLELSPWPTAPGQGALALETRAGEEKLVAALEHRTSRITVTAERGVLALLEAGCAAPVGATAVIDDGLLFLSARVYSVDGDAQLTSSHALYVDDARDPAGDVAQRVARELLDQGAAELAPLRGTGDEAAG
jgi:hydroxymethylbilane synthase